MLLMVRCALPEASSGPPSQPASFEEPAVEMAAPMAIANGDAGDVGGTVTDKLSIGEGSDRR
jgi:hypothetical protein